MNLTHGDIDTIAIERRIGGDHTVTLNSAEQVELIRTLAATGRTDRHIGDLLDMSPDNVSRIRRANHIETTWTPK